MIRWRFPFVAMVLGVIACTLLAGGLYLFLEYRVFRPAERWREKVSTAGMNPIPLEAGILSPLAAVAAERYGRALVELERGIGEREEKLRPVENVPAAPQNSTVRRH